MRSPIVPWLGRHRVSIANAIMKRRSSVNLRQKLGSWALSLEILLVGALPSVAQPAQPILVVVNKGAKELAIVDLKTKKVVGRVPVGDDPHSVAASTDGKLAFVANSN